MDLQAVRLDSLDPSSTRPSETQSAETVSAARIPAVGGHRRSGGAGWSVLVRVYD